MPMVDPAAIALTSPMLLDSITVLRRSETVGTNGRNTISTTTTPNVPAVVHVAGDNSLARPPESERQSKEIDVYTRFALRGASLDSQSWQPDLVQWHGDSFVVATVEDWGSYGEGYIHAHCVSEDMIQAPMSTSGKTSF